MFSITEIRGSKNGSNHKSYTVDLRSDIENLPTQTQRGKQDNANDTVSNEYCATGSEALCLEDSSVWVLSNSGIWKEL